MKKNRKTERIVFTAAGVAFSLLVIAMVMLLVSGSRETSPAVTATPTPVQTDTGETLKIAGKTVPLDTDTFYLTRTTLSAEDLQAIGQLANLQTLSLINCGLTDVSFLRATPYLTTLYLSDNGISDLTPLAALPSLRTLYLDNNPVTDLSALHGLYMLSTLSLKGVALPSYMLDNLRAALPACNVFDDSAVDAARPITMGGMDFDEDATFLDLSGRGISDITRLAGCEKLIELNLSGNPLESIATLTELPALKILYLSNTGLDDADLALLAGIRHLERLDITGNDGITAAGLDTLTESLPNCAIYHDEVFYKVQIDGETYSSDIVSLSLPDRGLTDISMLRKFERLESVDFSGNRLSDLSVMMHMGMLKNVNLERNEIRDLSGLRDHVELAVLDLSDNHITDVTYLAGCRSLQWLDLSNNELTYISHLALCAQLQWLDLRGNSAVTEDMVAYLRAILPACEILTDIPEPLPEPEPEVPVEPTAPPLDPDPLINEPG